MNKETRTDSDDSRAKREADGRAIYHYFRNRVALQNRVDLGSARVSRGGERVPRTRTFVVRLIGPTIWSRRKDCFGATPKPARETRALPETGIIDPGYSKSPSERLAWDCTQPFDQRFPLFAIVDYKRIIFPVS